MSVYGTALYLALIPLPLPVGLTIAPLLFSGLLLSLDVGTSQSLKRAMRQGVKSQLLALFILCYLLSLAFSRDVATSTSAALLFFPGILLTLVCLSLNSSSTKNWYLAIGLSTSIACASLGFLFGLWQTNGSAPEKVLKTLDSLALVVPNDMTYCVVLLPFLFYCYRSTSRQLLKLLLAVTGALAIGVVILANSRLAVLSILFALAASVMMESGKHRFGLTAMLMLCIVIPLMDWLLAIGILEKFANLASKNGRLAVWYVCLTMWQDQPLLGVGQAQFAGVYREALTQQSIPSWFWLDSRLISWSHSLIFESLLERGLMGLFSLITLCSHMTYVFYRRWVQAKCSYESAVFLAFVLFLFVGSLELTFQRNWVAVLFCLFIALYLRSCKP